MSAFAIQTTNLSKRFDQPEGWRRSTAQPGVTAVANVSLTVARGELFGLLGPNGAGKTTLVKMLSTLILPSEGELCVNGFTLDDAAAIRATIGLVVSDERSFYWRLSAQRNLQFYAALYGLHGTAATQRIDDVLTAIELKGRAEERFSNFSSGMRQRLAIARALLHRPQLLFLDEPTRSLDPTHTQQLHELITHLMDSLGMTVFLITHDLVEAEKLCDRVAVMHHGRIQAVGPSAELRRQLQPQQKYALTVGPISAELRSRLAAVAPDLQYSHQQISFYAPEQSEHLTRVIDLLRGDDVVIHAVNSRPPTLEEVFAQLTESAEVASPARSQSTTTQSTAG